MQRLGQGPVFFLKWVPARCSKDWRENVWLVLPLNLAERLRISTKRLACSQFRTLKSEAMMLRDKVAIITGASRGIGQGIALAFAKQGAKLVLSASKIENLRETEDQLKAMSFSDYLLTQANVSTQDEVNSVVKKALDTHGKVDILVNNAGMT